jgi:hypothetical protein
MSCAGARTSLNTILSIPRCTMMARKSRGFSRRGVIGRKACDDASRQKSARRCASMCRVDHRSYITPPLSRQVHSPRGGLRPTLFSKGARGMTWFSLLFILYLTFAEVRRQCIPKAGKPRDAVPSPAVFIYMKTAASRPTGAFASIVANASPAFLAVRIDQTVGSNSGTPVATFIRRGSRSPSGQTVVRIANSWPLWSYSGHASYLRA